MENKEGRAQPSYHRCVNIILQAGFNSFILMKHGAPAGRNGVIRATESQRAADLGPCFHTRGMQVTLLVTKAMGVCCGQGSHSELPTQVKGFHLGWLRDKAREAARDLAHRIVKDIGPRRRCTAATSRRWRMMKKEESTLSSNLPCIRQEESYTEALPKI
jgi:hypothetical protein